MSGDDVVLSEEAAVCIKNLMTNELLGSKCTRRLYALCILPLINQILEKIINGSISFSSNFLEAIAVQIWCIASTVPAALPQITASPLATLVTKRLISLNSDDLAADNALLQALLVAVEDNELLSHSLIQLNPQFLSVSFESCKFDSAHLNTFLRLMCFLQVVRCVPNADSGLPLPRILNFILSTIQSPLPEPGMFDSDASAVKLFFEIFELAVESFELLIVENKQTSQILNGYSLENFMEIPFNFLTFFISNFQRNFDEEGNNDRIRLVRRIFSIIGTLISVQEQLILTGAIKIPRESIFIDRMEKVLNLTTVSPSDDFNLCDEVSGWLRAWLAAWGESDYPTIPSTFFSTFVSKLYSSSSPVVLTNTCALTALLIPYAPESIQGDFCVFLNNLLCTDPFDQDHLEVLLAAIDGVTGIFDPHSKEWPAKSLPELKNDLKLAKERLQNSSCVDKPMKDLVNDRIKLIDRLYRIL